MGFKNLKLIKPTTKSRVIQSPQFILDQLETHFGKVQVKADLKFVPSFILYVCCLIEEAYSNKDYKKKINKLDELFKILEQFFSIQLNIQERNVITEIVEDLNTSKRIKKVSYLSKSFFYISNFFLLKSKP